MNPFLLKQTLSLALAARKALKENSLKRKIEDYDKLSSSAAGISDLSAHLNDLDKKERAELDLNLADRRRIRRDASGPITQAAHVRLHNAKRRLQVDKLAANAFQLDAAKERLGEFVEDFDDRAKKTAKRTRKRLKPLRKKAIKRAAQVEKASEQARSRAEKKARKAQKRAAERLNRRKRQRTKGGVGFAVIALLAAAGSALYWFLLRKSEQQPVADKAPRVEEYARSSENPSTLVYSTTSEDAVDETRQKLAGELAEAPAERDEELLGSIDDQLAAHRREEDAVAQASSDVDDAAQRLRDETARAEAQFKQAGQDYNEGQSK